MDAQSQEPRPTSSQRLFLALSAEGLEKSVSPLLKKLRITTDRQEIEVRWIPPELRHVTVLFLGNRTGDERVLVEETCARLASTIPPFALKVEGIDAFPEPRRGRVIIFHVQNSRFLRSLRAELLSVLALPPDEEGGYRPHLTIGRLRNPQSLTDAISPFRRAKADKLRVNEVVLFESVPKAPFPVYKILARFPLTGTVAEEVTEIGTDEFS